MMITQKKFTLHNLGFEPIVSPQLDKYVKTFSSSVVQIKDLDPKFLVSM